MRTKIVYVLVCNGDDYYYRQLLLSVQSVLFNSPGGQVEIVTDTDTAAFLKREKNPVLSAVSVITVPLPEGLESICKSRWLKTSLRQLIAGDYLFVDTDTLIAEDLSGIDQDKSDIAVVTGSHGSSHRRLSGNVKSLVQAAGFGGYGEGPYFNTGVMLVRDTAESHCFYRRWHTNWQKSVSSGGIVLDQPAFFATNIELGCPVSLLPDRWNCMVCSDIGIHFFKSAAIVHWYSKNERMKQFVNTHIREGHPDDFALALARAPKSKLTSYRTRKSSRLYNRLYALGLYLLRDHIRLFGWAERINRKLTSH